MTFCEECGAPVKPGNKFCESCGSSIPVVSSGSATGIGEGKDLAGYWLDVGIERDSSIDFTGAIEAYTQALSIRPDFYEALFNRGYDLLFTNRFQEAEESLARALVIRPDDAYALKYRAFALEGLGRVDEAKKLIARAVKIKPDILES